MVTQNVIKDRPDCVSRLAKLARLRIVPLVSELCSPGGNDIAKVIWECGLPARGVGVHFTCGEGRPESILCVGGVIRYRSVCPLSPW